MNLNKSTQEKQKQYVSKISAYIYISLFEIQKVKPNITEKWCKDISNKSELTKLLYECGLNISKPFELQENTHRTRFDSIFTGVRFVGHERTDDLWIKSGCASDAAIDKSLNSRMLDDAWRLKGLQEDYSIT